MSVPFFLIIQKYEILVKNGNFEKKMKILVKNGNFGENENFVKNGNFDEK